MGENFEKFVKVPGIIDFFLLFVENFAKVPGVVELRWRSDDPEFSVPATDLFEEQARGIPEWSRSIMIHFADKCTDMLCLMFMCCRYGQKDRGTTEQAIFACLICDCDLQSVKALRAHIKGGKHIRGERNKMKVRLNIARIANAVQVTICLLVSTSV